MSHSSLLDFDIIGQVGRGTFGIVYKCKRRKDGGIYVLKELKLSGATQEEVQAAVNECTILASVDSDYVIRYFDSFIDNSTQTLWLVMEYATQGTLRDLITQQKDQFVSEQDAWLYISQMILGIASLHAIHIIHRDIKSLNVFVCEGSGDQRYMLKIGDMGVSKQLNATTVMSQTLVGSPYYLSPEICKSEKYNVKSDIWALGVTFYEMLNRGKHPFLAQNQGALIINIIKGKYKPLPATYSQPLIDLVGWCLQADPARRPDAFSLLATPPILATIQKYKLPVPPAVQPTLNEAMQRLQRIKSVEVSRSRMNEQRSQPPSQGSNQSNTNQQPVTTQPSSQPASGLQTQKKPQIPVRAIYGKPVEKPKPLIKIESDVIVVSKDEIHDFNDDFDDEGEADAEARPETAMYQNRLNELLQEDAALLQKFEDVVREISSYQIQTQVKDELIAFFAANENANDEQIKAFVFQRIPYNKIGIVQFLRQFTRLQKQRQQVANDISKIVQLIKG